MVGAGAAVLLSCCLGAMTLALAADAGATSPMPVIIDTDYGSVFDDSAALALALQSPELDVKLVYVAAVVWYPSCCSCVIPRAVTG